jgi:hypothetical protein
MSEDDDESCAEPFRGELDASNLRRGDNVASHTDDEQVTEALIENNLRRHPRIRTSENNGERLLACRERLAAFLVRRCVVDPVVRRKATVTRVQALERIPGRDHRFLLPYPVKRLSL